MQRDLASMLHQKNRLAALGLAVSKINHDLRNLLAAAQTFSDQLSTSPDPKVQRFAPKLMRALERAIAFCQSTLSYGAAQEPPPDRKMVALEPLIEEVHEALGLGLDVPIRWIVAVRARPDDRRRPRPAIPHSASTSAAMRCRLSRRAAPSDPARDQIRITGRREGAVAVIEVSDTGPGIAEKARAHLFEAFQGSTRAGGIGPRPRHRRGTGARAWRRYQAGRGHHRRDLPHHHPGSRGQPRTAPRQRATASRA